MASPATATILHADLDAFYASVEQLLDPSLRDRPIAVGGGVVLAASYEARAYGVGAGMPEWRARRLCPTLTVVPGHYAEYRRLGDDVIEVFHRFTPLVERISIDEAFLDVAGSVHLFGSPAHIAVAIRQQVRREIGLPLSVGVARTKHLAKVASKVAKPDGLVVVTIERERAFLERLPVQMIWGVGPATRERLAGAGISTVGQLATTPEAFLAHLLGKAAATKLTSLALNVDARRVQTTPAAISVGAQAALGRREATPELLRTTLAYLADRVATRLRTAGRAGRTVTVRVRFTDLRSVTRATTVPGAVSATRTVTRLATGLAWRVLADHPDEREITLLGVSIANLVPEPCVQLELPLGLGQGGNRHPAPSSDWRGVDRSVDAVRARFGHRSVGYAARLSEADHVPEAFRELAERRLPRGDVASE